MARIAHSEHISLRSLEDLLSQGTGKAILDELRVLIDLELEREIEKGDLEHQLLLHQISKDLIDRETGQRGFLITGDETFLEPYYSGHINLEKHLDELLLLIEEEGEDSDAVKRIMVLEHKWETDAAIPEIELARRVHQSTTDLNYLENLLSQGTGKDILDELRVLLNLALEREEREGDLEQQVLLHQISKDLIDRETGQRGFLITGDETFLEPYHSGNSNLEKHLDELLLLAEEEEVEETEEEEEEAEAVQQIIFLAKKWETDAAIPEIDARRNIDKNSDIYDVAVLLKAGTGKNILDDIRLEFEHFIELERETISLNISQQKETHDFINFAFILGTVLIVIIGVFIALYSANAFTKPLIKLEKMAKRIATGKDVEIEIKGNDEITDLSRSFKQMSVDLRELDKRKEEFISMVSHELKTPLVPISLYAELLLDTDSMGELNEDQKSAVKNILESTIELKTLIDDVLDINKLELGKLKLRKRVVNVQDFVKETFEKLKPFTEPAQAKLILDMNIDGEMDVDTNRVFQVISNLVKNAIKFVPENIGIITLRVNEVKDSMVLFSVEDNGKGISLDNQRQLFQKFFQIDSSSTRDHGGTGLGLSISQGIVENHGGKIWYDNDYKDGAKFKFTLPRTMK